MCVRTKTSYGCGHSYKTTDDCYSSRCNGLERYHYMHEGDCRSCKTGGETVTRGREGKGRYAQQIDRRGQEIDREPLQEVSHNALVSMDAGGGASPWANGPGRREKAWQSPTRRKADDAWLDEHDRRMDDLQRRLEKLAGSPTSAPRSAPRETPERDFEEHDDSDQYQSRSDTSEQRRRDVTAKNLQQEIRSINQEYQRSSRRSDRHSDRHGSYDSIESVPNGVVRTPRSSKLPPTTYTYDPYDQYDSGYGSYSSRRSYGQGARTEPYAYSRAPNVYEVPVPPSAYGNGYQTGYGVEIYPRSATQTRYSTRRW